VREKHEEVGEGGQAIRSLLPTRAEQPNSHVAALCACKARCGSRGGSLHPDISNPKKASDKKGKGSRGDGTDNPSQVHVEATPAAPASPGTPEGSPGTVDNPALFSHASRNRIRVPGPTLVSRKSYSVSPKKAVRRLSREPSLLENNEKAKPSRRWSSENLNPGAHIYCHGPSQFWGFPLEVVVHRVR
jgi:hypothetical protein